MSYQQVPDWPTLKVEVIGGIEGMRLYYIGPPDDMVRAGIVGPDALVPYPKGTKKGRRDADGDRVFVDRYFSIRQGQPIPRMRVIVFKSLANGLRMPGALRAWRIYEAQQADESPAAVVDAVLQRIASGNIRLQ